MNIFLCLTVAILYSLESKYYVQNVMNVESFIQINILNKCIWLHCWWPITTSCGYQDICRSLLHLYYYAIIMSINSIEMHHGGSIPTQSIYVSYRLVKNKLNWTLVSNYRSWMFVKYNLNLDSIYTMDIISTSLHNENRCIIDRCHFQRYCKPCLVPNMLSFARIFICNHHYIIVFFSTCY